MGSQRNRKLRLKNGGRSSKPPGSRRNNRTHERVMRRNLAWPLDRSSNPKQARLLRPPAIVPNVSAIIPRNHLARDIVYYEFQRGVWNIGVENCLITFDAISSVSV